MRFVGLDNVVAKARRFVSGTAAVQDEEVKDATKLANILRQTLQRLTDLEARVPPESIEFEVATGTSGATLNCPHNFGSPVRWWVTEWLQTSGVAKPVSGPEFAEDSSSTLDTLVLRSYVAGRAVVRVEKAQVGLNAGVVVANTTVPLATVSRGTYASRPAAGTAGSLYFTTDGPLSFYDDGSAWQPLAAKANLTTMPLVSTFTAIQAGGRSTSFTDTNGGLLVSVTNATTANDYRLLKVTAPVVAYTLTAHVTPVFEGLNYAGAGLVWRQSSNGSCNFFGLIWNTNAVELYARLETASNTTASPVFTASTDVIALASHPEVALGDGIWLRMSDDLSATRTWSYSLNGTDFIQIATQARTTGLTPDEIGLWCTGNVNAAGTGTKAKAFFDSWVVA